MELKIIKNKNKDKIYSLQMIKNYKNNNLTNHKRNLLHKIHFCKIPNKSVLFYHNLEVISILEIYLDRKLQLQQRLLFLLQQLPLLRKRQLVMADLVHQLKIYMKSIQIFNKTKPLLLPLSQYQNLRKMKTQCLIRVSILLLKRFLHRP